MRRACYRRGGRAGDDHDHANGDSDSSINDSANSLSDGVGARLTSPRR